MNRPGVRQELDDLLQREDLRVVVEQIHCIVSEIVGGQVDFEQGEQQGMPELSALALGSPAAVGLCSLEVLLLVNEHLQSLRVFARPPEENGFLCVQSC